MKTWGDVIESMRADAHDDSEFDWVVPWDLLGTEFSERRAGQQFNEKTLDTLKTSGLRVVAWSSSHIYFLSFNEYAETYHMSYVARNPPL